ncbi:hypothetical protein WJX81_001530 [Elliptochloris bilobata]|uniref:Uncharacterized protein n=1 Tax=Elliptochloris bilobata TaxID=381761 RepID=A0AAW1S6E4_9CHLO
MTQGPYCPLIQAAAQAWSGAFDEEGRPHGQGTLTYPPPPPPGPAVEEGSSNMTGGSYEGAYAAGARQGKGTMTYPGGGRFEGAWAAGARSGFGTYWYPGGDIYQGGWRAGRRHGEGAQHCAALEAQYIGEWADGRFVQGRLVLKDGASLAIGATPAPLVYRSAAGLAQTGQVVYSLCLWKALTT